MVGVVPPGLSSFPRAGRHLLKVYLHGLLGQNAAILQLLMFPLDEAKVPLF